MTNDYLSRILKIIEKDSHYHLGVDKMSEKVKDNYRTMPGHWLLAKMGKRVLRPGGIELTMTMLDNLHISSDDDVAEFAPGMGATAKIVLDKKPKTYVAIEQNEDAYKEVQKYLPEKDAKCIIGDAQNTGLPSESADVLYGEAMLTMQPPLKKEKIIQEAARLLRSGGRYGIHELSLKPDDLEDEMKETIHRDLVKAIRVDARPLTVKEWQTLLEENGFRVVEVATHPMLLLEKKRMIKDEGLKGFTRITKNIALNPEARKRIETMKKTFDKYEEYMSAVSIVAEKI